METINGIRRARFIFEGGQAVELLGPVSVAVVGIAAVIVTATTTAVVCIHDGFLLLVLGLAHGEGFGCVDHGRWILLGLTASARCRGGERGKRSLP